LLYVVNVYPVLSVGVCVLWGETSVMNNAINTFHIGAYIGLTVYIALSIYCTYMVILHLYIVQWLIPWISIQY